MFAASNLIISAWADGVLVGVCRALTDYSYCCYLSDLAVDQAFQKRGIGKELMRRVQSTIGDEVSLIPYPYTQLIWHKLLAYVGRP